jgi:alcohol dehydrogenase class IV
MNGTGIATATFDQVHPRTRIVSGAGTHRRLPELLADLGASRVFVVCGRTVGAGPQMAAVREALGGAVVGMFDGVRPQAGMANLEAAAARLSESGADAVLSLGGGAAIDSAKFLILALSRTHPFEDYEVPKGQGREARPLRSLERTALPHIAIPTTAGSSSEIMPWAGIRDEARAEKMLFNDPLLVPDVAVLDPLLVVPTNASLTASSGATALARAVEATYSRNRQPIADAYALQAMRLLTEGLPRAVADGTDLEARSATQVGALLSGIAANNAMVSLVHAVGHAVGGRYGLQHGIAHRILLPPVSRLMLPTIGTAVIPLAQVLGVEDVTGDVAQTAAAVAQRVTDVLDALPMPRALRDVGVPREDIPDLVRTTEHEPMMAYCPRPVSTDEITEILNSVW